MDFAFTVSIVFEYLPLPYLLFLQFPLIQSISFLIIFFAFSILTYLLLYFQFYSCGVKMSKIDGLAIHMMIVESPLGLPIIESREGISPSRSHGTPESFRDKQCLKLSLHTACPVFSGALLVQSRLRKANSFVVDNNWIFHRHFARLRLSFITAKGLPSFAQHSIRFHGLIQDTHVGHIYEMLKIAGASLSAVTKVDAGQEGSHKHLNPNIFYMMLVAGVFFLHHFSYNLQLYFGLLCVDFIFQLLSNDLFYHFQCALLFGSL